MRSGKLFKLALTIILSSTFMLSGCAVNFYKQSPRSKQKIQDLKGQISDLEMAKRDLESKLSEQIANNEVSVRMDGNGLVIVLSNAILFNSGKADLRKQSYPILSDVASVIRKNLSDKDIGVEGHTDNIPIKQSGWKSNWELSTARATTVLHYMEDKGIPSKNLSATGYGEHRPVASNKTKVGRAKNRRVEIVILPALVERKEDVNDFVK